MAIFGGAEYIFGAVLRSHRSHRDSGHISGLHFDKTKLLTRYVTTRDPLEFQASSFYHLLLQYLSFVQRYNSDIIIQPKMDHKSMATVCRTTF